ncbi:hypothetical protein PM082_009318 [Marasmius tenuissimus]|nr:hypothetical protein PM082_009318 [Marasmius tenuissimus]
MIISRQKRKSVYYSTVLYLLYNTLCRIRFRKKRREYREKQQPREKPVEIPGVKEPVPVQSDSLNSCLRDLEGKLDILRKGYRQLVELKETTILKKLCLQAIDWKRAGRLPFMERPTCQSPLVDAKGPFESKICECEALEDEYCYATREKVGVEWDDKRGDFTIYKGVVSEFIGCLEVLQEELDCHGPKVELEDLLPIYDSIYWYQKC